jgi:HAD superfamily hydrolase (TIGR01509 family)
VVTAVVFDMDGVLIDSEQVWDAVRDELVVESGGHYGPEAQQAMMGMSSREWSRYMHEQLGLPQAPEEINREVVRRLLDRYRVELPLIPEATGAVRRLADAGLRLALASSSNRPLIDTVLAAAGVADLFEATVSSEEVSRGKPWPDVYLEAARRIGVAPSSCAAVEDSSSGLRAAHAAGMRVIAYPNKTYPPAHEALALASARLDTLDELTPELLQALEPVS